jgi:hypothetical protein
MTVGIVVCLKLHAAAAESRWAAVQNGILWFT